VFAVMARVSVQRASTVVQPLPARSSERAAQSAALAISVSAQDHTACKCLLHDRPKTGPKTGLK
jgi:hypothetical protein